MRFHSLSFPGQDFGSFSTPNSLLGGRLWARAQMSFARGECWICPPSESLSDQIIRLRDSIEDLQSIPGSDLIKSPDRCFEVGGDPDGHHYFISSDSGEFYVWWHDPDEITRLDVTAFSMNELIEWSIRRDPAYPRDRNWSTFVEMGAWINVDTQHGLGSTISLPSTRSLFFGHPQEYPFIRIRERMAVFGDFEEQFESDQVLALLQPHRGFLVEMTHRLRGRRCQIHMEINRALISDASFVELGRPIEAWLKAEGFCDVDDLSVSMPGE